MRIRLLTVSIALVMSALLLSGADNECSFLKNPDEFMVSAELRQKTRSDFGVSFQRFLYAATNATAIVDPNSIARKNFIDDQIFGRMASAGIRPGVVWWVVVSSRPTDQGIIPSSRISMANGAPSARNPASVCLGLGVERKAATQAES